ncbi:MAG TPA: amino acid adenylation domain-containing protein, partial [Pseudonocardiaceae bacterium]
VRPPLTARERPAVLPLSPAQQRLWLLAGLDGGGTAYNFPLVVRLRGGLDVDALAAAAHDVVARHEVLRTVFGEHDGEPVQRVLPAGEARVPVEVRDVPGSDLDGVLLEAVRYPFDLTAEIPLRLTVARLAPDDHAVVLLLHHVATDEWSDRPFLRDLSVAYAARRAGTAPEFPPLPVQYADHALWQREVLGGRDDAGSPLATQLAYWERTLAGAPEELELPADRPRPARPSFQGAELEFELKPDVAAGLRRVAAATGASMFMVLHAASAALLHRLGAGTDLPIGAPVAGRTDAALDDLVGFFVNTLVLRTDVSGDPTFTELVGRVKETALAAFSHSDVPFEAVVERLNPVRSAGRNPLFQVMVGYHSRAGEEPGLAGLRARWLPVEGRTAKFDLVLAFTEHLDTGRVECRLEYATDLFDRSTAVAVGERLTRLLTAVAEAPGTRVGEVDVLGEDERRRVLVSFNDTGRAVPELSLPALVAGVVARRPHEVAVVDRHRSVDHATLDDLAGRTAALLRGHGVGPGQVAGIAVPRGVEQVAAVLAVLRLGAAYLPLDLTHPADRVAFMLADSGARVLVTTTAEGARVPHVDGVTRVHLDAVTLPAEPVPPVDVPLDAPAYVIYTSGSTGRPKGVVVPHEGIAGLAATAIDRMGLTEDSRVLQFASVGFDVAVFELVMALCVGGRLVLAPDEVRVAGPELTDFLRDRRVTHLILPPSLVSALPPGCELPAGSTILVGTETVPPDVIRRWAGHLDLIAAYGLTEATVNSTLWPARPGWDGAVPIGVPDPNTRCYVLDAALRPAPIGVPGELYVGGRGLALGYLGRHPLTAERFVADPFGPPGARMYRTGDRARWRADGNLDFLGRVDTQVKVRGMRVEPGEIEAALATHPAVRQAAVIADRHQDATRLVGYVSPEDGTRPDPAELRAHLAGLLPEHMVPAVVVPLDGPLPLTPNGKLDRRALPAPVLAGSGPGSSGAPPTPEQAALAELVAAVLGLPSVGVHDTFFALGGHSMSAMRLLGRVRTVLGAELTVRDVFDAPTVAGLAALLAGAGARRPPVRPV